MINHAAFLHAEGFHVGQITVRVDYHRRSSALLLNYRGEIKILMAAHFLTLNRNSSPSHPGELLVPAEHVHSDQLEHAGQWRQDLLGNVVGGVEAEAGVLQHLHGPTHQLDEGHPGHPVYDHVRHPLANARLQAAVVCHHTPESKDTQNFVGPNAANHVSNIVIIIHQIIHIKRIHYLVHETFDDEFSNIRNHLVKT